ncbi:hypothetical protein SDJN03_22397, partial [Cucurbita argyrosperma subsp. sororia]
MAVQLHPNRCSRAFTEQALKTCAKISSSICVLIDWSPASISHTIFLFRPPSIKTCPFPPVLVRLPSSILRSTRRRTIHYLG